MSFDLIASSADAAIAVELIRFRVEDQFYCYTSGVAPVVFETLTYTPDHSIQVSEVKGRSIIGDDEVQITVPADHPVARKFEDGVPESEVTVEIFLGYVGDSEFINLWHGIVTTTSFDDYAGTQASLTKMVCKSRWAALSQKGLPYRYGSGCQHAVYRGGCVLNPELHRRDAILTSVNGAVISSPSFALHPDGDFVAGFMRFATTKHRGIVAHAGTDVTLNRPMKELVPGSLVSVFRGCNRTATRCLELGNFDNILRFDIPQRDIFREGLK